MTRLLTFLALIGLLAACGDGSTIVDEETDGAVQPVDPKDFCGAGTHFDEAEGACVPDDVDDDLLLPPGDKEDEEEEDPELPPEEEEEEPPAYRVSRHWKFKLDEVDQWVREGGASEAADGPRGSES